jgi:hypothetical protein
MKRFDQHRYTDDQIIDALTCPVNRHCTRVEHNCDDWELYKNPEWLLQHYIGCGGAAEFAKRRGNKKYWVDQKDPIDKVRKIKKIVIYPIRYLIVVLRFYKRSFSRPSSKSQKSA